MNIRYKAIDRSGKLIEADVQSKDRYELMSSLKQQGLTVVEMKELENDLPATHAAKGGIELFGISQATVAFFTRQFAELIDSGIPLTDCLVALRNFTPSGQFANILDTILLDVQRGTTLHQAMAKHPDVFNHLYISLVEAGEASGNIQEMLNRLADYLEQEMDLRSKLKSAMTYPAFIMAFSLALVYGLVAYLLPTFEPMWQSSGLNINDYPVTVFLMWLSRMSRSFWRELIFFSTLCGMYVGFRALLRKPDHGRAFDNILMKIPVLGNFVTLTSMTRVSSTLGTLIRSGTSLLRALELASGVAGNAVVRQALIDISTEVAEGKNLATCFQKRQDIFPPLMVQMISIGEVSGQLDKMLPRIARYYQSQLESAIKAFSSLIEPITMVVVGGVVFTFVIGVFLPIMGIVGALTQKL